MPRGSLQRPGDTGRDFLDVKLGILENLPLEGRRENHAALFQVSVGRLYGRRIVGEFSLLSVGVGDRQEDQHLDMAVPQVFDDAVHVPVDRRRVDAELVDVVDADAEHDDLGALGNRGM